MSSLDGDELAATRYLLLTTFEPDGSAAAAPVWVVADGSGLGVWTRADSAEVRRIRRHPGVLVQPCDAHGRPLGGSHPARAALCGPEATACYRTSLLNKYGFPALLTLARSRLRLGLAGTVGIRLTLTTPLPFGEPFRPDGTYSLN
ncbi:PPOX class F420-dependent oxidoreductase [Kitasatospora sp. NPDC096147]|uniref:PPOX class F420-dependent oxidoreductase n=1 Tax=Kitasatospora sp. NPDC096147 TaxID=3364093 RepID=UPI0037F5868D